MEFVVPEFHKSRPKGMTDADEMSLHSEEEHIVTEGYRSISRVNAGQGLRFAVSKLPHLTSLELISVDLKDAKQHDFRLLHSWKHLR